MLTSFLTLFSSKLSEIRFFQCFSCQLTSAVSRCTTTLETRVLKDATRRRHLVRHQQGILQIQIADEDAEILPGGAQLDRFVQSQFVPVGKFAIRDGSRIRRRPLPLHEDHREGRIPRQALGKGMKLYELQGVPVRP